MLRGFPFQDGKRIPKLGGRVLILSMLAFWGGSGPAWAQLSRLEAERQKNFGVAYLEQEQPKEAATAFAQVIASAPGEALGYANTGAGLPADGAGRFGGVLAGAGTAAGGRRTWGCCCWWPRCSSGRETGRWRWRRLGRRCGFGRKTRWRATHSTARRLRRKEIPGALAIAAREMDRLFELAPQNLAVAVKYARFQAEQGNPEGAARGLEVLRPAVLDMAMPRRVLDGVEKALAAGDAQGIRRGAYGVGERAAPHAPLQTGLRGGAAAGGGTAPGPVQPIL